MTCPKCSNTVYLYFNLGKGWHVLNVLIMFTFISILVKDDMSTRHTRSLQAWYSNFTALNQPGFPNVPFAMSLASINSSTSVKEKGKN